MAGRSEVVKLFVGQIPKTLEEDGVRDVFKEFGDIVEIVILRDRRTGMHQGCCFVKYTTLTSAQAAIQALHNQRSLPPLRNPLQVRFADSGGNTADRGQTNAENKLFVGGVPVGCGDKELRSLFSNYGEVQDVYILASKSSQEGQRGCAFVRYAAPQSCAVAIEALHGKYAMKAGELPLVVRFADPPKSQRGGGNPYGNGRFPWPGAPPLWAAGGGPPPGWPMPWGMGAMPGMGGYPPWVMPPGMQPPYGQYGQPPYGGGPPPPPPAAGEQPGQQPQQQQPGQQQQPPPQQQQPPLPASTPPAATNSGWSEHQTPGGFKYYYHPATGTSSWDPPAELQSQNAPAAPPATTGIGSMPVQMPNVNQLASSMTAMSMSGGSQQLTAMPNQQPPQQSQPPYSAAPPSAAPMGAYPTKGSNGSSTGGGGFQDAIGNGYGGSYSAATNGAGGLGGGGLGGLGMPTGGISELGGVPMAAGGGLGNGSALPGLSSLGGNGPIEMSGNASGNVVLVRDLPDHFTSQELTTAFAQFGKIVFCELGEGNSGRVGYESPRDATQAVATMNGLPVGEKMLHVSVVGGLPY